MDGKSIFTAAVAVVESGEKVLGRIGGIPEAEHSVVAIGHAPIICELAVTAAGALRFDFEDVGAGLVDAASGQDEVAAATRE